LYISHQLPDPTADPKVYGSLLSEIVATVLGILLVLRGRGLTAALAGLRYAGLPPTQRDAGERSQEEP